MDQFNYSVAIGYQAGFFGQAKLGGGPADGIAIGRSSGYSNQRGDATAIGRRAGYENQGRWCVAIGAFAGETSQPAHSIILNATGSAFNTPNNTFTSSFFVKPIRNALGTNFLVYNTDSGEITYV
jgi:hypothetical protein